MREKKRKSFLAKFLIGIMSFVMTVLVVFAGFEIYFQAKHNISLIKAVASVASLKDPVDEDAKFTSKFGEADKTSVKEKFNTNVGGELVTVDSNGHLKIDTSNLTSANQMTSNLVLTDKELGALLSDMLLSQGGGATITMGDMKVNAELVQIHLDNINAETKSVDFNVVLKLDLKEVKKSFSSFPMSLVGNNMPDFLYVSTTVVVTPQEQPFSYSVAFKDVEINNLDKNQTQNVLKILNLVMKTGSTDELCTTLAESFVNAVLGSEENNGITYMMKALGAVGFDFELVNQKTCLVIRIA